jgi:hypothetical protein
MKNILIITGSIEEAEQYYRIAQVLNKKKINVHFTCTRFFVYEYLKSKWDNVVFVDKPSINKQKSIDIDSYLSKYNNPTISEIIFSDHVVKGWNQKKQVARVAHLIDFYEDYFKKNNIKGVLSFPSSGVIARTAFAVANRNNIKVSVINTGPVISNSSVISCSEKSNSWPEFEQLYNTLDELNENEKREVDKKIELIISDKKRSSLIRKPTYLRTIYNMVNFFFRRYDDYEKFELKKEIDFIKGFLPFNHYFFDKVPKEKFIFFPTHLSYDAQICVRNPMYYDQEFIIKNLSISCPPGYTIVVKAHPYNSGGVIKQTYKLCKKLKNVKIVNTGISSFELIKKAEMVAIINSTAGIEAIIQKKPLLVFGNAYFEHYKNSLIVNNINDLPLILNSGLSSKTINENFDDEYYKFLFSIFKTSKKGSFNFYKNYMSLGINQEKAHIENLANIVSDNFNSLTESS